MTIIDSMLGRNKPTVEEYKSHMPLLDAKNPIVVSFHELDGREKQEYKGKYKIEATKGGKKAAYVVDPNAPSVNKAVVEAIIGKLNGGEEKVVEPSEQLAALNDAVDAFNRAVDELDAGIAAAAADKITAAAGNITVAAAKISDADKSTAIAKINEAITAVDTKMLKTPQDEVDTKLKTALEAAKSALEPKTTGGYNSAKSAVPKRITRIRRTRRSAKRTGTRRRLHI